MPIIQEGIITAISQNVAILSHLEIRKSSNITLAKIKRHTLHDEATSFPPWSQHKENSSFP